MRKIKVEVTRKHIDTSGHYGTNCPIYVAIKEQYPELDIRFVEHSYIRYDGGKFINIPSTIRAWLRNHDYWKKLQEQTWGQEIKEHIWPITFELEVPNGD